MLKKEHCKWTRSAALQAAMLVFVILLSFAAEAADAPQVAMRVGRHDNYTRIVFDFPKLTAYYARKEGDKIVLTFDTPSSVELPRVKSSHILGITQERPDVSTEKIVISVPGNATFKHYRLLRKIVVDVSAADTQTAAAQSRPVPPAPAPEKPPVKAAEKPEEKPVQTAAAPAPVPSVLPPPPMQTEKPATEQKDPVPEEMKSLPVEEVSAEKISAPLPEAAPEEEPTKITISTVEPAHIAVFTRFGTLWVVMDTKAAGAIAPDIKGPQAGFLGKAKLLKFDGGIAYRHVMPPNHHISVSKRSLTWEIMLTRDKKQMLTNTQMTPVFDDATGKAKLVTELRGAGKVLDIEDPLAGDRLYVVPAASQDARIDQPRRFADLEIIPAAIGLVARPLKDGIRMNRIENFVMITAPDGIAVTPGAAAGPELVEGAIAAQDDKTRSRLFDFPNWRQGGIARLNENRRALENLLAEAKTTEERSEVLMKLALLFFANNFGHETLGVLRLIEAEDEEMPKNPNFIAVRGAAAALAGHYNDAIRDLSNPVLQQHPEVVLWTGYAAAATEQWHMANRSFPKDNYYLVEYPQNIAVPFTVYMAESALRLGNTEAASRLLQTLDAMGGGDEAHYQAAITYLKGEAARQEGDFATAMRLWTPVAHGLDRLYHAKASLALANLQLQEKRISLKEAINTIDSLRFAWRGDGLEVQILSNLGQLKIQNRQFLSGLQDMKAAAGLSEFLLNDPKPIEDDMARVVFDLFAVDGAKDLSPLEAVSIYNEFEKYLPHGKDGMTAALNFADYLIRMDLLGKAAALLEKQIAEGLPAEKNAEVGAKLAATYLLDDRPAEALAALDKTASAADGPTQLERGLLRARAQSQLNLTNEAIATLSPLQSEDAVRLRADVLWRARKWALAAEAIEGMLPSPSARLDDDAAGLVVNAAVAWKLAGDPQRLQAIRSRYQSAMALTSLGPTFGVVTRDGGPAGLSDRETILRIAGEVDMFKSFLDTYQSSGNGG